MKFNQAADLYLKHIFETCEPCTYANYRKRLHPYRAEFGEMELSEITEAYVLMLVEDLSKWPHDHPKWPGQVKKPDTLRSNVQAWEQIQKWLIKFKHLAAAITPNKIYKPSGRKRETLPTKEETKLILEHGRPDFVVIYRALRLTGARPGELCKAQISDINHTTGEIVLVKHKTSKKTGKPRRIAIGHESLLEIIKQSIGNRTSGNIFLQFNGLPWETHKITTCYRTAREKAGLREDLIPYLARHEHATQLYAKTGDLLTVASALGHTQLNTAARYTRVNPDQMKKNQRLFEEELD